MPGLSKTSAVRVLAGVLRTYAGRQQVQTQLLTACGIQHPNRAAETQMSEGKETIARHPEVDNSVDERQDTETTATQQQVGADYRVQTKFCSRTYLAAQLGQRDMS